MIKLTWIWCIILILKLSQFFLHVFHLFFLSLYILRVSLREVFQLIYLIFCCVQCTTRHIYWVFFSRSLFLFVCILLLSYGCNIYYITLMRILIVPIYRLAVFCCSFNLVALDFLLFGEHGASCSWCWFFSNLQGLLIVHIFMW